jgi:hypothetical protein
VSQLQGVRRERAFPLCSDPKGRQGEFTALSAISPATRAAIEPVIEIVPEGERDDASQVQASVNKCATKLGNVWGKQRAFLDATHVDMSVDLGGHGPVYAACDSAEDWGVLAVPVLRLDDPELARQDVAALHRQFGRGVCIRLIGEDLDEDPIDLEDAINTLLSGCGLDRSNADLILDASAVDSEISSRGAARMIGSLLRDLDDLDDWRTITVAGGGFPADLSAYDPWVIGERPRFDADLWAHVMNRRRSRRIPDYGDYAVAHPLLSVTGVAFAPAPQLRYTIDDQWLILKGRRKDPEGHAQFYRICDMIRQDLRFAGAAIGAADLRIANPYAQGPGNATIWRQLGTTHHLDFVVQRLTTLGEP